MSLWKLNGRHKKCVSSLLNMFFLFQNKVQNWVLRGIFLEWNIFFIMERQHFFTFMHFFIIFSNIILQNLQSGHNDLFFYSFFSFIVVYVFFIKKYNVPNLCSNHHHFNLNLFRKKFISLFTLIIFF